MIDLNAHHPIPVPPAPLPVRRPERLSATPDGAAAAPVSRPGPVSRSGPVSRPGAVSRSGAVSVVGPDAAPAPEPTRPVRRPRLLLQAARAAQAGYNRETHLARLTPTHDPERDHPATLARLRALEAECEDHRRTRAAAYSIERHVSLLAALLAETRRAAARG